MITLLFLIFSLNGPDTTSAVVESAAAVGVESASIALRADGRVVLTDLSKNSVVLLDAGSDPMKRAGGKGWSTEGLNAPGDVSTSFLLDIFVTDLHNRRVQRYDKGLRSVQTFDEQTVPAAGSIAPVATAVTSFGDVLILDADGGRVLQWSPRNGTVHEFVGPATATGGLREPKDIAVGPQDGAAVLDGSRVIIFDRFGNPLTTIPIPAGTIWKTLAADGERIAVTGDDRILILDRASGDQHLLLRSHLLGASVTEPIADIAIQKDHLLLLTATTLYRCTIVMP